MPNYGFDLPAIDDYSAFLKAYWRMEETGAANRVDDVGSNDLVPTNDPGTRVGINNNACDLTGVTQFLSIADNPDLSPTTSMVVSLWVYADILQRSGLFEKDSSYRFDTENLGQARWRIWQSDSAEKKLEIAGAYATVAWHHFVCIAESGHVRLYIDDDEKGTSVVYDNTIKDTASPFYIANLSNWKYWDGSIDEVGFWKNITFANQAARDAFVAGLYNSGNGRFYHELAAWDIGAIEGEFAAPAEFYGDHSIGRGISRGIMVGVG